MLQILQQYLSQSTTMDNKLTIKSSILLFRNGQFDKMKIDFFYPGLKSRGASWQTIFSDFKL